MARRFPHFLRGYHITLVPMPVNGEPDVPAYQDDRLVSVIALVVQDGLIAHLHASANPPKPASAASLLDVETRPIAAPTAETRHGSAFTVREFRRAPQRRPLARC